MTPLTQFVDQLTGPAIIRHLADVLRETSDDFPESEVRYHKAVDELRAALPEGYTPTVDTYLEAMEMDKILNTSDLLPTVLNLLGVDSQYHYIGRDAFEPAYDGFVPFADGSWVYGNLGYDASEDLLFTLDGSEPEADADYLAKMHQRVQAFVESNNLILKTDYYRK